MIPAPVQTQVYSPRRRNNRQASSTSGSPRNQVLAINCANSGEPAFPSIQNPVPVYPQREEHRASSGEEIVYTPPPPQTIQTQEIYAFYPEQIYIASVISTRSPIELREFKDHCITLLMNQTRPTLLFNHDLREIRRITSSALHFQNLLWRKLINISSNSITEGYSWIRRRTLQGRTDQAYLEPAYQVTYQYRRNEWTVYQVRNL